MGDQVSDLSRPEAAPRSFPYANWGPWMAVAGVLLALATGLVLGIPVVIADHPAGGGELSDTANALVQLATAVGFVLVPMVIAAQRGAGSFAEAARRLGVRVFRPSAAKWMLAAIGSYLVFSVAYSVIVHPAPQKDIAEGFGAVPVQVLLIVVAAPISEEICFRGMLFGGLRERLPRLVAALISALVFGGLHATTGVDVVPVLMVFGFVLALLYEKTGSIVPGILLHMLNNSVTLLGH